MNVLRTFFIATGLLIAPAGLAAALDQPSLVESTYMDRGSVGLFGRTVSVGGRTAGLIGAEWSWAAHPRVSVGLTAGGVGAARAVNPDVNKDTRKANLTFVGLRAETPVFYWQYFTVAGDLELGTLQLGYRGSFYDESDKWRGDNGPYAILGVTTYVRVSPETEVGLGVAAQQVSGINLVGFDSAELSGQTVSLRLKRWF